MTTATLENDLDLEPTEVDVSTGPAHVESESINREVGDYVEHHPALCFATAFAVGVTCAWWLKRA